MGGGTVDKPSWVSVDGPGGGGEEGAAEDGSAGRDEGDEEPRVGSESFTSLMEIEMIELGEIEEKL